MKKWIPGHHEHIWTSVEKNTIPTSSSSKLKVVMKFPINSSELGISCRGSNYVYQFIGIVSRVWINMWDHASLGNSFHTYRHVTIWSLGLFIPLYFPEMYSLVPPNLICINLLHCDQYWIEFLCATHHLAGVALKAISKASSLCWSTTTSSNSANNVATSPSPSKWGNSHTSEPICRSDLVILEHILTNTSCSRYFQFSNPSYESEVHELMLRQLKFPSTLGFI